MNSEANSAAGTGESRLDADACSDANGTPTAPPPEADTNGDESSPPTAEGSGGDQGGCTEAGAKDSAGDPSEPGPEDHVEEAHVLASAGCTITFQQYRRLYVRIVRALAPHMDPAQVTRSLKVRRVGYGFMNAV